MKNICLYFQIHHPFSLQTFRFFDVGSSKSYYDDLRIEREIHETATNYYIPTNEFLLKQISQSKGKLKISFYISGTALDQFLTYEPKLINSFRQLAETGQVEFLGSTSSHSISSLVHNLAEFKTQIKDYKRRIENYFGTKPKVFANTDLLFTNAIANTVEEMGYNSILTNGAKKILQWRSPNYLYSTESQRKIKLLFRNEMISNEFTSILNNQKQIKVSKNLKQIFEILNNIPSEEPVLNILLNYKLLGGIWMQRKQLFISDFFTRIINHPTFLLNLPSDITDQYGSVSGMATEEPICWVNQFHSSYYPGNGLQTEAIKQLFKLEKLIGNAQNQNLQFDWKYLQTSDHFHLMDENHPDYQGNSSGLGNYKSKYDAFINYMNILEDFRKRLKSEVAIRKSLKNDFVKKQPIPVSSAHPILK